jgi:hypothetical protein
VLGNAVAVSRSSSLDRALGGWTMTGRPNQTAVRFADAILADLRSRRPGQAALTLLPIEHASPAARAPEVRTPEAPLVQLDRPAPISAELDRLRLECARACDAAARALERNDVAALLEAEGACASAKARAARFALEVIGDRWRDHRDPLWVANNLGSAVGLLRLALEAVRRGTVPT